jgi:hypothetical protein
MHFILPAVQGRCLLLKQKILINYLIFFVHSPPHTSLLGLRERRIERCPELCPKYQSFIYTIILFMNKYMIKMSKLIF